jgi:hypothetical protein
VHIDSNTYLGYWPFAPLPEYTAGKFANHLVSNGIKQALVSPLNAVFLPEPMPANRKLFTAVKSTPSLIPIPIINPTLGTWRDQLDECLHLAPIHAVKILPNYHNYRLTHHQLEPFMETLAASKLQLVLNVRLNDERTQYFALSIKGVPQTDIANFLNDYPASHPLLTGIFRPELKQLASQCENFSADISFCEWKNTLVDLLTVFPPQRLMLGTCSPLLSTRGQVDKLNLANIPKKSKTLISSTNAKRFFRL